MPETVAKWLLDKFLEWQHAEGKRMSQAAFARHLDVNPNTLAKWMSGENTPDLENVEHLAMVLNDDSIYTIANFPKPDPLLTLIQREWDNLSEAVKNRLLELIERDQAERNDEAQKPKRPKARSH